ncbi:YcnI family protein [Brackiella oedipodis]|uniref:YcnI family copper-binding membrane protein n=1 Tax=Brackiella oedipodis TaxID=124225 RepID=UPI000687788D|nr:YcnI family protein [Brackiella oedipodis]
MLKKSALFLALAAVAGLAQAHVHVETPKKLIAQKTNRVVLSVPHGCDGEATKKFTITIPEGFVNVHPQPKADWDLDIEKGKYEKNYELWGKQVNEGVKSVTWSGKLPDDQYDEFLISGFWAGPAKAGDKVYFAAKQECESKTADWSDTSGAHIHGHDFSKPMSAPAVDLAPAKEDKKGDKKAAAHDHDHDHDHSHSH